MLKIDMITTLQEMKAMAKYYAKDTGVEVVEEDLEALHNIFTGLLKVDSVDTLLLIITSNEEFVIESDLLFRYTMPRDMPNFRNIGLIFDGVDFGLNLHVDYSSDVIEILCIYTLYTA